MFEPHLMLSWKYKCLGYNFDFCLCGRVCTIFRKGATSVASRFLLDCLNEVADHYNTSHVSTNFFFLS